MVKGDALSTVKLDLRGLSRAEKQAIALGDWASVPSIVPFLYSDGPNGVRDAAGATAFPSPLALAASFDVALAARYGTALASEVLAAGRNVLLGPVLDIARVPWDGRTGEGLGEDPELTAQIGGAVIDGVQGQGVLSVVKHLVANNAELMRTGSGPFWERTDAVDVIVDEATLRDVYLLPFERVVREHGAAGLMSSYNRVAGRYPAEDATLWKIVREEWGFEGVTIPDFLFAVRDDEKALRAGLDLPGLGDPHGRTREMISKLTEEELDTIVEHVLRAAQMVGLKNPLSSSATLGSDEARALAHEIAAAGAVLLANDGILPLSPTASVVVIEPEDLGHLLTIGGSAGVEIPAERRTSLSEALQEVGLAVRQIETAASDLPLPSSGADGSFSDIEAVITIGDTSLARSLETFELEDAQVDAPAWAATISSQFAAPKTGAYRITLAFAGDATLLVNGTHATAGFREASPMISGPQYPLHHVIDATEGHPISVVVEYSTGAAISVPGMPIAPHIRLGITALEDATAIVASCAEAQAVIFVAGRASGEAMDVDCLELPEDQLRLLEALCKARPVVLVTLGSGPLVLPDLPFSAVLHGWQSGETGPAAIAEIIAGLREPRGRLPLSFPMSESQVPLEPDGYPGLDNQTVYNEGVDVGYRGYERRGRTPRFPFGHGLGYADIVVKSLECSVEEGAIVALVGATERSGRKGVSVLQLYVAAPGETAALREFRTFELAGGATEHLHVRIPLERLGLWATTERAVRSGDYAITASTSGLSDGVTRMVTIG